MPTTLSALPRLVDRGGGRPFRLGVLILVAGLALRVSAASAQTHARAYDGWGNNAANPTWGATGDVLLNRCRLGFPDGRGEPAGSDRPNARTVSNIVFAQRESRFGDSRLSDLWWAFGQFVDHDLTLTGDDERERFGIPVPPGDPLFDPDSLGGVSIPMARSAYTLDGLGVRRYANELTAFLDAGAVYGDDETRAAYLRSFSGGKLRTSAGDLPPFNTLSGEYAAPVDPYAPTMAGDDRPGGRVLVCGDVRANENPLLAAMHTVWLREHNRLCDSLAADYPGAGDEELYWHARQLVEAQLQRVVYAEWLPAIGLDLGEGSGYDARVNPAVSNEFAVAAFRLGHTLVGAELLLLAPSESPGGAERLSLREAFFAPTEQLRLGRTDALLRGAAAHRQQALDCAMVDDLRNFLFGAPGAGGLDLAAINIQRGRERGVASFADIRSDLGLPAYVDFAELTGEAADAQRLTEAYGPDGLDDLDAWVGMLAERKTSGELGETVAALLADQFSRIRAGDRFYYEHAGALSRRELAWVAEQTLAGVLRRNGVTGLRVGSSSFHVAGDASGVERVAAAGDLRIRRYGGRLVVEGARAGELLRWRVVDALGRELTGARTQRADEGGAALIELPGGSPLSAYFVEVAGSRGASATVGFR